MILLFVFFNPYTIGGPSSPKHTLYKGDFEKSREMKSRQTIFKRKKQQERILMLAN